MLIFSRNCKMAASIPKVVVVGGVYIDMAVKCEHVPLPGQGVSGSSLSYTVTGAGANEAVEAALCGCRVHLISKVGGGPFGGLVKETLAEYGVETDFVHTAEAKNTGMVVTMVNSEGENAVCTYCGANGALVPQDIEAAEQVIAEAEVCLIHARLPQNTIIAAIRCAQVNGTRVILNPAAPIQTARNETGEAETLPIEYFTSNVVIPNLYEAAQIVERSGTNINAAKTIGSEILARGAEAAVITMGKRGCMVVDRNGADHIPAFEIKLVDHTGTGDAFAGALAASCAVGDDIRQAVKFASAAGALVCTKFGVIEALPTKAEILELLMKEEA